MAPTEDWTTDPYLIDPEPQSIDAGTTNIGPLWHLAAQRWGHSMHTMCPYQGMFPAKMVHYFIQTYTQPGDLVVDPFSGRGTTVLQARVEGRSAIGSDLSPLAYVLSKAKANPPPWDRMMTFIEQIETEYAQCENTDPQVSDDIRMLFDPYTLDQLWFIRGKLIDVGMEKWGQEQFMIAGAVAGIIHGGTRSDGSSAFLSISMPNTFSMSPAYVRKYINDKKLVPPRQNVFDRLREKLARLYADDLAGSSCSAANVDAVAFMSQRALRGTTDLVCTSPPYMKVVNYGTSNWIRLWWLGLDDVSRHQGAGRRLLNESLDHGHNYEAYEAFMGRVLHGIRNCLKPHGVAAVVIGDVQSPDGTSVKLAENVWRSLGSDSGLRLIEMIEDDLPAEQKVSRIWGETRGQATIRDCILVLTHVGGKPRTYGPLNWSEPYKDGGPDAAHDLLQGVNRRLKSAS